MNSKRRQRHTRQTLENRPFRHDHAIILDKGDPLRIPRHQTTPGILARPLTQALTLTLMSQGIRTNIDIPRRHPQQHLILRQIRRSILIRLPRRG